MKGKLFKKVLAVATSFLMLSGSVSVQPVADIFKDTAIKASAATQTETRTATWYLDGGASGSTTLENSLTLLNADGKRLYYYNTIQDGDNCFSLSTFFGADTTVLRGNVLDNQGELRFTNLEGTVTKVELNNFSLVTSGIQMYVGRDKTNTSTLLHLQGNNNDYDVPSSDNLAYNRSATFEGSIEVSESSPLKIMFKDDGHNASSQAEFGFAKGYITVTYEVEVEVPDPEDPGHTFSFNASGNTLTATCTETASYHHCSLGSSRTSTLTLTADDVPYTGQFNVASLNLGDFIDETGLAVTNGGIVYRNKSTGEERTNGEKEVGDYTVTATIIISGTSYTLTKDFSILVGFKVNNSYKQFTVSPISAFEGDEVTITFTPQMDESLDELTLTGATSGDNITYTHSGNTYTFAMPAEDVNLSATITYPLNENNIAQSGDTYTIKNAEGWNYFCRRMEVDNVLDGFSGKTVELADNITVSTMAGTKHPFKGTFDGKGKTLTFNRTADTMYTAPFQNTDGATIRNLHATGLIEGGVNSYLGGLVGSSEGNLNIENCRVSTQISTTFDSNTLSANVGIGGIVGYIHYTTYGQECRITGTVYDGLIYNPNYSGTTYGCGGFIGCLSEYAYVDLTDCLFIEGQYDNNGGRHELLWGHDNNKNSTFFHRINNQGQGKLTNCFYVGTHGLKQGSPAVESTTAPTNFAHFDDPTDHCFMQTYGHMMVFGGKYYTPIYGDLVETYDYSGVKDYNIEYDDAPLGIPDITSPLWTECLRYNRSFTAGKPEIIMLPFNITKNRITLANDNANPSGKFYEFQGLQLNTQTGEWEPKLTKEVTEMKANTPYLYVSGESTEYWDMYVGSGISIFTEGNDGGNKTVTDEYGLWTLTGAYEPKSFTSADFNIMVLNDDGELGEVTGATTVAPTSGYFVRDNSAYSVNVSPAIGGTVTADPLYAKENDTVTLTVTPNAGYVLKSLLVKDSSNNPITVTNNQFTMPDSNVEISAIFEKLSASAVSITTQPTDLDLEKGASSGNVLTVEAEAITGHTLSYQWYKNTTNSTEGGSAISGATEASYAVPTDSEGTGYYYCVVTATRTDNGETATATSNIAVVTVADYSTVIVNVTGNGTVTYNDKSTASGETIGVTAEKGTDVTLTLTPENGYAVRSVEYGYTNNSGTTASGFKLPVSGTTATLTVPDDLKDGTGVTVTVTFAPALNGGADEASAVALTDATVTDLGGGWYKVENDISFDHTLNLLADTYLTIAEGKTMSVNTTSGKAIDSEYTLNVSGEGALNITTTEAYKIAVRVGSYVQTGATVTANGYIGIRCMDNFDEFNVTNDFTFSGGQLTATGSGGGGIWADNDITLSCTNATDFIQASSYSSAFGAVKIAEGKMFKNGSDEYSGTLSNNEIKGKKLIPATKTLKLPTSITGGTLTADQSGDVLVGDTVTLTVTPDAGYTLKSLTVMNGETAVAVENNQFTMPAGDVTVSAEFAEIITYTEVPAKAATCTEDGNIKYYTGSDGKLYVDENGTLLTDINGDGTVDIKDTVVTKLGHDWNAPTYSWTATAGGYKCTATRTCKNGSHPETEEVTATYTVVTPPTAGAKGLGRYTATFTNGAFEVQTKDVDIDMVAPEYGDPTYTWADDNSSVTAFRECLNGGANLTETVNTTSEITKAATCTANGETTYYAVFANELFTSQEKTVANIATTDHSYTESSPIWSWVKNGDSYDVSVQFKCSICGDIEECDEEPELSFVDEDGYRTYTASVEFEGETYTMSQRVKLSYNVTVNGVTTQYAYDEIAEAKITTIDEGKFFDGWYEGDKKVSSLMTYTFTVRNDVTLEARFVESAVQAEPILNFSVSEREVLANGKNKVSFTVEWELPDDCTLVQAAIIRSYTNTDPKYNSSDATVKVSTLRDLSGSYKYNLTLGTASASKTIYARGYIIYLDKNGTSHQMYTDVIVSNSIS